MDKQPTKKQIREFWELCGIWTETGNIWHIPNSDMWQTHLPPIDLNHLFRHAVPKLRDEMADQYIGLKTLMLEWLEQILQGKDPALALFWVLYPILKEGK